MMRIDLMRGISSDERRCNCLVGWGGGSGGRNEIV